MSDFLAGVLSGRVGTAKMRQAPALAATELTDFFQERKRRQEAEELAKSVFA